MWTLDKCYLSLNKAIIYHIIFYKTVWKSVYSSPVLLCPAGNLSDGKKICQSLFARYYLKVKFCAFYFKMSVYQTTGCRNSGTINSMSEQKQVFGANEAFGGRFLGQ
jgi:hypothetical protein